MKMPQNKNLIPLSLSQKVLLEKAKKYAADQTFKHHNQKVQTVTNHSVLTPATIASMKAAQRARAIAIMCRVYVGSIHYDITQETVKKAFEPYGPVKCIDMSQDPVSGKHKGYCFIDYEYPEAAHLATMGMQNYIMPGNRMIKVGRPSNIGQAKPIIEQMMQESQQYHRIYVASIHPNVEAADIKLIFGSFGKIQHFDQDLDVVTKSHRGYTFIEYAKKQDAEDACKGMNGFDLGGFFLRVGIAITPPSRHYETKPQASIPQAAALAVEAVANRIKERTHGSFYNLICKIKSSYCILELILTRL